MPNKQPMTKQQERKLASAQAKQDKAAEKFMAAATAKIGPGLTAAQMLKGIVAVDKMFQPLDEANAAYAVIEDDIAEANA